MSSKKALCFGSGEQRCDVKEGGLSTTLFMTVYPIQEMGRPKNPTKFIYNPEMDGAVYETSKLQSMGLGSRELFSLGCRRLLRVRVI